MKISRLSLILFLMSSLLSGTGLANEVCAYKDSADNKEIVPPLRQALGDDAFNEAMSTKQYSYAGNAKCRLCHRDFFLGRKGDAHDHSYEKLVARKPDHAENPRCLTCHTTGHGVATGFKNMKRTAKLANVQCEGCHGPGSVHIKRQVTKMPMGGVSQIDRTSTEITGGFLAGTDKPEILKKMCQSCHTKRWSNGLNNFDQDYNSYRTAKPDDNNKAAP